jgi:hypothetical protein
VLKYKTSKHLKYKSILFISSYYILKGGVSMYYYGNGYNYTGTGPTNYGTPYYYPPYNGNYGGVGGAWAFALVIFILLIIVGCWCGRGNYFR